MRIGAIASTSTTDKAAATFQFRYSRVCCCIRKGKSVNLGPPSSSGIRCSPKLEMNTSDKPAMMPGKLRGKVTLKKASEELAPRTRAASI
jgi:hypothetical protein